MAVTIPRDFTSSPNSPNAIAMHAWVVREIAQLLTEEREKYDASESFRDMVHGALEFEWRNPGPTPMEWEAEETYGGDAARCFVERFVAFVLRHHPAEKAARIAALRAERYGADVAYELRAIEDGTHPAQQLRC
jgi:hypothetical protein